MVNAAYTRNRCPTAAVACKTPEEAWSGTRPCISHMRVFGCIAYAKVPDEKRTKLESKAIKCLFLGYCVGTRAYRVMCLETKKIIKSRDVTFMEDKDDMEQRPSRRSGVHVDIVDSSSKSSHSESEDEEESKDFEDDTKSSDDDSTDALEEPKEAQEEKNTLEQVQRGKVKTKATSKAPPNVQVQVQGESSSETRYPGRVRQPPGEWWMNHILPPREEEHANVALVGDPISLSEALMSNDARQWEQAMEEEYDAHMANGTWELEPLPEGRKSVGCK